MDSAPGRYSGEFAHGRCQVFGKSPRRPRRMRPFPRIGQCAIITPSGLNDGSDLLPDPTAVFPHWFPVLHPVLHNRVAPDYRGPFSLDNLDRRNTSARLTVPTNRCCLEERLKDPHFGSQREVSRRFAFVGLFFFQLLQLQRTPRSLPVASARQQVVCAESDFDRTANSHRKQHSAPLLDPNEFEIVNTVLTARIHSVCL